MTTEEKARAYDEALARARKCLDEKRDTCFVRPDVIFPELKESEDEKIRRTIIRFFKDQYSNETEMYDGSVTVGKVITWLEKQRGHKVWTDNDYDKVKSIEYLLHEIDNHNFDDWFNSLKK